ncbi:MAG: acylneuraminate cytidylyltransferase family protein [Erysipelotrichaceae bacterium]|nr:acylneuraminate cytidylyltransferase family protein [Erysipelotrichaceae bacterium]
MRNIAIIPARSGSKGIEDKNIKLLGGKPLMAYTIETAVKSGCFDVVMVSTDSEEYKEIALEYGAEVPFLRDEETATDKASVWSVCREVLLKYIDIGKEFDTFTLLQPTTPLRSVDDIKGCFKMMEDKKADAVVSMCELECSMHLVNTLPEDNSMDNFISEENYKKRRQDIRPYYHFNGAIYLSKVETFMKEENIYKNNCYAYIMDRYRSFDIDEEIDFKICEALLK